MSHNQDNGSYEEDDYYSEDRLEHDEYVPEDFPANTPPRMNFFSGDRPPILASNADILEQLYQVGYAINNHNIRLESMEQKDRQRSRLHPHNHHRAGRIPQGGGVPTEGRPRRTQLITPRRLEYSDKAIPYVEHPDDVGQDQRAHAGRGSASSHPHRSGRALSEIQRDEERMNREKRDLVDLKERLGIRLSDDDLKAIMEQQKEKRSLEKRPLDSQREPPESRSRPREHERALPGDNPRHITQRAPPDNRLRPHGYEHISSRRDFHHDPKRAPPDTRSRPHGHDRILPRSERDRGYPDSGNRRMIENRRMMTYQNGEPLGAPSGGRSPLIHQIPSRSASKDSRARPTPRDVSPQIPRFPAEPPENLQGENPSPLLGATQVPGSSEVQNIPGIGTFNVDDLKRLLSHLDGGRISATAQTPSPFSKDVKESPLPMGYRSVNNDLRFHGKSDPVEFLGRFDIEMEVFQVNNFARCRFS